MTFLHFVAKLTPYIWLVAAAVWIWNGILWYRTRKAKLDLLGEFKLSIYQQHCLHMRARRDCTMHEAKREAEKPVSLAEFIAAGGPNVHSQHTSLVPTCCKCGRQDWKGESLATDECPGKEATTKAIDNLIEEAKRGEQEKEA